ncbi:hypothetical protein AD998_14330 [bacterium 336/3]|nr:hypothetical protein AD998_14330 [bacterium 336/3]
MTQEERQQKFELFVQAMNVPSKIEIYKPTYISLKIAVLFSVFILLMIITLLVDGHYFFISFLISYPLLIFGSIYYEIKRKKEEKKIKKPEVILNSDGIYTREVGFFDWDDIRDEHIRYDKNIQIKKYELCYQYPNGNVRLQLTDFFFDGHNLQLYLKQYRELHHIKKNTFNL